jgi:hypothetical protein
MEIIHGEGVAVIIVHLESCNSPVLRSQAPATAVTGNTTARGIVVTVNTPLDCDRCHIVAVGRVIEEEDLARLSTIRRLVLVSTEDEEVGCNWGDGPEPGKESDGAEAHFGGLLNNSQ